MNDRISSKEIQLIRYGSINGIDSKYYSLEAINHKEIINGKYNIPIDSFIFGFVGRIVKDKGIDELIASFSFLQKKNDNLYLLILGEFEDDLDPVSSATLQEMKKNSHIIIAGSQKDVRQYYKSMNVFILPSYREGFGLSLLEAQCMEVPCIASDISGCNEIIKNNYNGILIPPKSKLDLTVAMEKLLINRRLLGELKRNTRNNVINKYNQKLVWKASLEMYDAISKNK